MNEILHYLKEQFPEYDISYSTITLQITIKTPDEDTKTTSIWHEGINKLYCCTKTTSIWHEGINKLYCCTKVHHINSIYFDGYGAIDLTNPESLHELTKYIRKHHPQ